MKVSKNSGQADFNNLISFSGDDEEELVMLSKDEMSKGETIVNIPLKSCISLDSTIQDLVNSINKYSSSNPKFANYLQYTSGLLQFDRGNFIKSNMNDKLSGQDKLQPTCLDHKFSEFVAYKRILTLKSLILCDLILSIDNTTNTSNPYERFNSVNSYEKELLLLTMALSSEYFLNSISQVLNRNIRTSHSKFIDLKKKWLKWLFNKKVSHIPLMFDKGSVEQIQEPIIQNKIVQRKLALTELFSLFTDPLSVIRDKIESLTSGSIDLAGLEEYLLNNNIKHEVFSENIFKISKSEVNYILTNTNNITDSVNNVDTVNTANLHNDVIDRINSMMNFESILNFFCTINSHIIRPKIDKTIDNTQYYYMLNTASGINCHIVDFINFDVNGDNAVDSVNSVNSVTELRCGYLVPLISLCNHSNSKPNSDISLMYSDGELSFNLKTNTDISAGSEILFSYGDYDNNTLLLDYGFVSGDEGDNWVLMSLDNDLVRDSAKKNEVDHLLPSIFPEGIPKEKLDLIKQLNLIEVNDKGDLTEIYSDPYFDGMPIVKYMEFNQRFMANTSDVQSNLYYSTNSKQDRTIHVDKPVDYPDNWIDYSQNVNNIIKINSDGIIDHRLILLIKIILCKTKKKLEWIKNQNPELLSKSINSPIDHKAFEVVSSIPLLYFDNKYDKSLFDDICSLNVSRGILKNLMLTAHAMRRKIPFYKCSHYYRSISSNPINTIDTRNGPNKTGIEVGT
ncbi:SET domain protein [Theileria parva strain Muguga]|uniref:SET domain protein n=1 Tax=Theileria parva strain Muguga TaxID=333668 RepID=UPI001C617E96|nr:SET domain protein [Theileria parva strain Muguga]EAN31298.2 SET domain protein [Theileria parva strain Muguga]